MKAGFRAEDAKNLTADCADLADREPKTEKLKLHRWSSICAEGKPLESVAPLKDDATHVEDEPCDRMNVLKRVTPRVVRPTTPTQHESRIDSDN